MLRACVQGRFCARRPGLVLAVAAAVVALCALGLVLFAKLTLSVCCQALAGTRTPVTPFV